ncbi:MAG: hypothetical protein RL386_102 [Bacteroidota bacterium]
MKPAILVVFLVLTAALLPGQDSTQRTFDNWIKYREGFRIEPLLMWQIWTLYSHGQESYQQSTQKYQPVEDRLNIHFRRARFGFRAQPFRDFRFTLVGAYDVLGRDALTGTQGGTNNLSLPNIGIWDAYMEWRILPEKESLWLVAGYFRPQFSRESITGAWAVPSLEKSMSQNYLRKQLVGYGPGRAMGLNLGGIWRAKQRRIGLNYNLGVFTPQYIAPGGLSTGSLFSSLWVGRIVLELGDPESAAYKINYDLNFYGKRNGLSLGFSGAYQGTTDLFAANSGLQGDILWNTGPINVDAEYNRLWRRGDQSAFRPAYRSGYATGHIRSSINLVLAQKYLIEPSAMLMFFSGATNPQGQADAAALKLSSGSEYSFDLGVNWHLQEKKMKLLLHYIWRTGDPGSEGPGAQVNAFFFEPGIGPIRRGNVLGLGLHVIL